MIFSRLTIIARYIVGPSKMCTTAILQSKFCTFASKVAPNVMCTTTGPALNFAPNAIFLQQLF